jgi:hypothetical protein
MSGFELSLFEQLTAEHHAFAFLLVLDFFLDETRPSTSAMFRQNKKSTCQTKLHFKPNITDKCIA